jgi:hypothetical protein
MVPRKDTSSIGFKRKMKFVRNYAIAERGARGTTTLFCVQQFETSCLAYDNGGEFGNLIDRQIIPCEEHVWRAELQYPVVLSGVCREIRRRRALKAEVRRLEKNQMPGLPGGAKKNRKKRRAA